MFIFSRRCDCHVLAAVLASVLVTSGSVYPDLANAADPGLDGLVQVKPQDGRFVRTSRGYMVPYTTRIPGSDVTFTMMPIPGGTFKMGSPPSEKGRGKSEGPQIQVQVAPCWIAAHEVSWAEFKQYMALHDIFRAFEVKGIRPVTDDRRIDAITAPSKLYDPDTTFQSGEDPRQPAVMMTQYAAKQYTKWLSALTEQFYRLPSEAEWEYACRAGTTGAFHFGEDTSMLGEYAWFDENAQDRTHKVGMKRPNPWGLFDMHGNAAEWVLDRYTKDGYAIIKQESGMSQSSIKWPTEVFPRVVRGGSFEMKSEHCRSASRLGSDDDEWKLDDPNLPASPWWFTTTPATGVGFRILRPLTAPKDRQGREQFWKADVDEIAEDAEYRIVEQESGAIGIVDKALPEAIKKLK